jgi:hypothetical protein
LLALFQHAVSFADTGSHADEDFMFTAFGNTHEPIALSN